MSVLGLIFGLIGLYAIGMAFSDENIEEIRKQNEKR